MSACRGGTLKNQPNKMGTAPQHIHAIPTSCANLPTKHTKKNSLHALGLFIRFFSFGKLFGDFIHTHTHTHTHTHIYMHNLLDSNSLIFFCSVSFSFPRVKFSSLNLSSILEPLSFCTTPSNSCCCWDYVYKHRRHINGWQINYSRQQSGMFTSCNQLATTVVSYLKSSIQT